MTFAQISPPIYSLDKHQSQSADIGQSEAEFMMDTDTGFLASDYYSIQADDIKYLQETTEKSSLSVSI